MSMHEFCVKTNYHYRSHTCEQRLDMHKRASLLQLNVKLRKVKCVAMLFC